MLPTRSGRRGITAYLSNGGTLERAQQIAGHASPKTTKLYDRTADTVTVDEIFRDQMATAAAIDRLVHHAVVIEFDVPSYRTDRIVPPFPARSAHDRSGRRVRSF